MVAAGHLPLLLLLIAVLFLSSTSFSDSLRSHRRPISRSPGVRSSFSKLHSPHPDSRSYLDIRRTRRLASQFILAENSTAPTAPTNRKRNANNSTAMPPAMAPSPSAVLHRRHRSHKHRKRNWIIGFIVGVIAGFISGVAMSLLFRLMGNCITGRYRNPGGPTIFSPQMIKRGEELAFLEKKDGLASLEIIGRGGCGEVYKAQLPPAGDRPGTIIAIKRIMKRSSYGAEPTSDEESKLLDKWMRQIRNEINTVGHIRHRNLLPLLAHVVQPTCHYLIYEFMKNGSLEAALLGAEEGTRELNWPARYRAALGVASGLEYLHSHHKPHIIHRDMKPANVLLDDEMEARIADFGLAKEMPDSNTHMTSTNVAGTLGYIAPEYHSTLKYTDKCDVYSFGVILAALVVGKLPSDEFFQSTEEMSMLRWVRNVMTSGNPTAAVDRKLVGNGYEEQMLLVLRIACFCTVDDPKQRPQKSNSNCGSIRSRCVASTFLLPSASATMAARSTASVTNKRRSSQLTFSALKLAEVGRFFLDVPVLTSGSTSSISRSSSFFSDLLLQTSLRIECIRSGSKVAPSISKLCEASRRIGRKSWCF